MLVHWIWLATRPDISDREKCAVLSCFSDAEDVFYAQKEDFSQVEDITEKTVNALMDKDLSKANAILRDCTDKHIHICTYQDAAYPGRLKNIIDPPLVLYYKGRLPDFDANPVIGIVGTRKCTAYGIHTARRMGAQIARCGGIIVSGIARGIDASGMSGALSAGGFVVGVLGCGADVVYPYDNKALFADTEANGCLLSEFPPRTPPYGWNFPKRNRIISGLSNGVLIVEAPKISGALITAEQAAEQGKDVFVVPGNVDMPSCEGGNALLREGATPVTNGWDVISEYQHLYPEAVRPEGRENVRDFIVADGIAVSYAEEKPMQKVAQKPITPDKNRDSDRKKEKKPIDNRGNQPYSDIRDIPENLTEQEKSIVLLLQDKECLVDDIIAKSNLGAAAVLASLTVLEIKGVVKRIPGKRVALK